MAEATATPTARPTVALQHSPGFPDWLREAGLSLAVTTYQTNRLFLVGAGDGRLSAFERLLDRPMGLAADGPDRFWLATRHQLWRFQSAGALARYPGYDRVYVPRESRSTGEVDAHDVALDADGRVLFVNTLYSCLATLDEDASFAPVWRPPFVSALQPEDRCHLNGVAMAGGRPRFATAASRSDVAAGWRERRRDGGVVIDVASGDVVCSGLSMPHSPRVDAQGRLWLLDSGNGNLGYVEDGRFQPVCFLAGYGRGMTLVGDVAVIGLSKARDRVFHGLALQERLREKEANARCGVWVVELSTGRLLHWLEFTDLIVELYDVVALPGAVRPMALGFRGDDLRRVVSFREGDRLRVDWLHTLQSTPAGDTATGAPLPSGRRASGVPAVPAASPPSSPVAPPPSRVARAPSTVVFHAVPGATTDRLLHDFPDLTFPPLGRRGAMQPLIEPLFAVAAWSSAAPVALAVATRRPPANNSEVISLFVHPEHRGRGIAGELLARLEVELATAGLRTVQGAYRTSWTSLAAIERLLGSGGWTPPATRLYMGRTGADTTGALRAAAPLPEGCELFSWSDLRDEERQALLAAGEDEIWYPDELGPFQATPFLEPAVSMGVRRGGEVVAWLIAHRIDAKTIQYSSLVVRPDLQRQGLTLALIAEARRRRLELGYEKTIFNVAAGNTPMLQLVDKVLRPILVGWSEVRVSRKDLGGTPGGAVH